MQHSLFDEPKTKNPGTLMTAFGIMALSAIVLVGELSFLPREHTNAYSPHAHARSQQLAFNN